MSTPPRSRLVETRLGPGVSVRTRITGQGPGTRFHLAVADASVHGGVVELPPISAKHLEGFLRAVAWAVGEAMAQADDPLPLWAGGPEKTNPTAVPNDGTATKPADPIPTTTGG
jgi:hypothetical protein